MIHFGQNTRSVFLLGASFLGASYAIAQTSSPVRHLTFDSPEGWALKYFTSVTMMSGLQPPEPLIERRAIGSITLGLESDWLPALNPERARVGFTGRKQEDLSKAPVLVRPSVRVSLPWRLTAVASAPPPITTFGITPRLLALGVERPIVERKQWMLGWRASGQVGHVKADFTCPTAVLGFPLGSPQNPSSCVGSSNDTVSLRYVGTELQFSYRIPKVSRVITHATAGYNYVNTAFQVNAPLKGGLDRTRLFTSGNTVNGTAGVSYLLTKRVAFTVDAFYSPLFVRRVPGGGRTNDGLFNVRSLISYTLR